MPLDTASLVLPHIAAFAITDIYCFISKNLNHDDRIKAVKALFNIMNVVSTTIEKAMSFSEFADLEDALQMQCLNKVKGDYIITRDEEFQRITDKAISPKDFIRNISDSLKEVVLTES